jgi:hypothetical protein
MSNDRNAVTKDFRSQSATGPKIFGQNRTLELRYFARIVQSFDSQQVRLTR